VADSVVASISDAVDNNKEMAGNCGINGQCCERLKLELKNITIELESAIEIIGILKEELGVIDTEETKHTSIIQKNENVTNMPTHDENWIQIQTNRHNKMMDKLKDYRATSIKTSNSFEVLSNLKTVSTKEKNPKTSKRMQCKMLC
jgi:hypothetical protein